MPPLPADSIHARACKLKCEKILTRPVDRAFRVPPFSNWWMGWRFTTSFGAEKKQETFSDFLLGGAAGGRLVFSFESSGQGGPMMK